MVPHRVGKTSVLFDRERAQQSHPFIYRLIRPHEIIDVIKALKFRRVFNIDNI